MNINNDIIKSLEKIVNLEYHNCNSIIKRNRLNMYIIEIKKINNDIFNSNIKYNKYKKVGDTFVEFSIFYNLFKKEPKFSKLQEEFEEQETFFI